MEKLSVGDAVDAKAKATVVSWEEAWQLRAMAKELQMEKDQVPDLTLIIDTERAEI